MQGMNVYANIILGIASRPIASPRVSRDLIQEKN